MIFRNFVGKNSRCRRASVSPTSRTLASRVFNSRVTPTQIPTSSSLEGGRPAARTVKGTDYRCRSSPRNHEEPFARTAGRGANHSIIDRRARAVHRRSGNISPGARLREIPDRRKTTKRLLTEYF